MSMSSRGRPWRSSWKRCSRGDGDDVVRCPRRGDDDVYVGDDGLDFFIVDGLAADVGSQFLGPFQMAVDDVQFPGAFA